MTKVVNIHEAKTQFSRLVDRARAGERIVIGKAGVPVAVLSPITDKRARRTPGHDRVVIHADFDAPLPEWDPAYSHPEDPLRDSAR